VPDARQTLPLVLKVDGSADAVNVSVRGDLDFTSARRLERLLDQLGDLAGHQVTLDFAHTGHVDSTGLTAIVAARLRADRERFELVIENVPAHLARLLRITGLDRMLLPG
jgi:anti-sigma B factor antagonist